MLYPTFARDMAADPFEDCFSRREVSENISIEKFMA